MDYKKTIDFMDMEIDFKRILKYTGKTLATIASPPIGLALWAKESKDKLKGVVLGSVLSALGAGLMISASDKKIYNSENLKVSNQFASNSNGRTVVELLTSPVVWYLDSHKATLIQEDNKTYSAEGDDVINFVNGKYQLNLGLEKRVRADGGKKYFSVKEAAENIRKYERELGEYLQKGEIENARKAKKNIENTKSVLTSTTQLYNQTRDVFQKTVNKMNSELESLAK